MLKTSIKGKRSLGKGSQKKDESVVFEVPEEKVKKSSVEEPEFMGTDPTKKRSQKSASRLLQSVSKSKPEGTTDFLRGKFKAKYPNAAAVLSAYLGFRQPGKAAKEYLIPKDRAAWLDFLVNLVKKKTNIEYLNDR
jgi:hypothetical protein